MDAQKEECHVKREAEFGGNESANHQVSMMNRSQQKLGGKHEAESPSKSPKGTSQAVLSF